MDCNEIAKVPCVEYDWILMPDLGTSHILRTFKGMGLLIVSEAGEEPWFFDYCVRCSLSIDSSRASPHTVISQPRFASRATRVPHWDTDAVITASSLLGLSRASKPQSLSEVPHTANCTLDLGPIKP